MTLTFTCPGCARTLKGSDALAGKQTTCPRCKHRFFVPGGADGYAVADADATPACPGCRVVLVPGAVLCVSCGYDLRTGKRLKTTSTPAAGPRDFPSLRRGLSFRRFAVLTFTNSSLPLFLAPLGLPLLVGVGVVLGRESEPLIRLGTVAIIVLTVIGVVSIAASCFIAPVLALVGSVMLRPGARSVEGEGALGVAMALDLLLLVLGPLSVAAVFVFPLALVGLGPAAFLTWAGSSAALLVFLKRLSDSLEDRYLEEEAHSLLVEGSFVCGKAMLLAPLIVLLHLAATLLVGATAEPGGQAPPEVRTTMSMIVGLASLFGLVYLLTLGFRILSRFLKLLERLQEKLDEPRKRH